MGTRADLPAHGWFDGRFCFRAVEDRGLHGFVLFLLLLVFLTGSSARAQSASECLVCHGASTGLKNSEGKSIAVNPSTHMRGPHSDMGCLDCHAGASAQTHNAKTAAASCVTCHADSAKDLASGAHAALGNPNDPQTCIACHGTNNVKKAVTGAQFCATCHTTEVAQYRNSVHGRAHDHGNGDVPTCQSCHGSTHTALAATDPRSPVSKGRLPDTCGSCHSDPRLAAKYMFAEVRPVQAYRQSVHGRAVEQGNQNAATCNDCHGTHDILPASDPQSKIWKQNVAATCGRCHAAVYQTYASSIHGQAVAKGVLQAATCTDCHNEHRILAPGDPGSPVYMANVSQEACSRCHADAQLMAGFNLPQDRVPTYEDSYHGLAAHEGRQTVANCASCHGVHDIYPSSDPRSTVNRANLSKTCGQCHTDAGRRFAIGPVHAFSSSTPGGRILDYVRIFYLIVIPVTLGLMLLHNLIDWRRKARVVLAQYRRHPGQIRLTLSERVQHGLLVVSFIVLVITGFALKFPHAFWVEPIVRWEHHYPVRGWIHRIAGVVLIGASVYHVVYMSMKKSGRRWLKDMIPDLRDAKEAVQTVEYNLGRGENLPQYRRFNYAEKAEYWALVWGTAVMAITGVLLWLNDWILAHLPHPASILAISTAIHFYEAILATAAIVIWHLYAVIFDPDIYPLKWTFLTGRAPEHEVREQGEGEPGPRSEGSGSATAKPGEGDGPAPGK
ncbi:MAG TPA: cytochrome b/b6 domain-containing protein [Acidobacteriaceae bacterium]|jgi:formate dehydrogenase gamma subunit|nr:cytochrome b/b6 domain-containing protein [Acidobacteriaceae bacterium]